MDNLQGSKIVDTSLLADVGVVYMAMNDQAPLDGQHTIQTIVFTDGLAYLRFKNYLSWQMSRKKRSP